jgi:hypothetical protein
VSAIDYQVAEIRDGSRHAAEVEHAASTDDHAASARTDNHLAASNGERLAAVERERCIRLESDALHETALASDTRCPSDEDVGRRRNGRVLNRARERVGGSGQRADADRSGEITAAGVDSERFTTGVAGRRVSGWQQAVHRQRRSGQDEPGESRALRATEIRPANQQISIAGHASIQSGESSRCENDICAAGCGKRDDVAKTGEIENAGDFACRDGGVTPDGKLATGQVDRAGGDATREPVSALIDQQPAAGSDDEETAKLSRTRYAHRPSIDSKRARDRGSSGEVEITRASFRQQILLVDKRTGETRVKYAGVDHPFAEHANFTGRIPRAEQAQRATASEGERISATAKRSVGRDFQDPASVECRACVSIRAGEAHSPGEVRVDSQTSAASDAASEFQRGRIRRGVDGGEAAVNFERTIQRDGARSLKKKSRADSVEGDGSGVGAEFRRSREGDGAGIDGQRT